MNLMLAMAPLVLSQGVAEVAPCKPIAGWEQVIAQDTTQFIIVGEVHGTNEAPDIFADAVCLTAQKRSVVVAVEQPETDQGAIDSYIASDGGDKAISEFLKADMWQSEFKDGRSSQAMFKLFERLRIMKRDGQIKSVVAFQPVPHTPLGPEAKEQAMADLILKAGAPDVTVVALVGNLHAMREHSPYRRPYKMMASLLPQNATITLNAMGNGGSIWACMGTPVQCGPQQSKVRGSGDTRGIALIPDASAPWSGALFLGTMTTASPPQVPLAAE